MGFIQWGSQQYYWITDWLIILYRKSSALHGCFKLNSLLRPRAWQYRKIRGDSELEKKRKQANPFIRQSKLMNYCCSDYCGLLTAGFPPLPSELRGILNAKICDQPASSLFRQKLGNILFYVSRDIRRWNVKYSKPFIVDTGVHHQAEMGRGEVTGSLWIIRQLIVDSVMTGLTISHVQ